MPFFFSLKAFRDFSLNVFPREFLYFISLTPLPLPTLSLSFTLPSSSRILIFFPASLIFLFQFLPFSSLTNACTADLFLSFCPCLSFLADCSFPNCSHSISFSCVFISVYPSEREREKKNKFRPRQQLKIYELLYIHSCLLYALPSSGNR